MSAQSSNCHHILKAAHQRSEITHLILNPYAPKEFISIGHDGYVRTWSCSDFSMRKQVRFRTPYLTCIVAFGEGFLLALGNGSMMRLNKDFEIQSSLHLHDDCLSSILVSDTEVITTGHDGRICFLNKTTLALEWSYEVESPIYSGMLHENSLYLAGNPAYRMDLLTRSVVEIGTYNSFLCHGGQVLGCSDEKGVTFLSSNKNTYVPCQFMISVGRDILVMAEGTLGIINFLGDNQVSWEITKAPFLRKSLSILSGIYFEDNIILAGECSNLYKFSRHSLLKSFGEEA